MGKIVKAEVRRLVAEYVARHPELSYKQIAEKLGCSSRTVLAIYKEHGGHRRRPLGVEQLKALEDK